MVSNSTFPSETSTLDIFWVHVFFIAPPILGLIWTIIQWVKISSIVIDAKGDDETSSESEDGELVKDRQDDDATCEKMKGIGGIIAQGAKDFLITEYLYMVVYVVLFSGLIVGFYIWSGLGWKISLSTMTAFIVGAITSILSGYIGMAAAVMSNSKTTFQCWKAGNHLEGLVVALRGGSILGFGLCSLGVVVLYGLIMVFKTWFFSGEPDELCEALAGFGLGGSSIALFGRVGGGIYTKAADVGADLSGKLDFALEEDDYRNPACIADNVGDNVGDIAGMGADLFGSFAESTVAALVIASKGSIAFDFSALYFPVLVSSSGIVVGILTMLIALCLVGKIAEKQAGIETTLKLLLIISTILETVAVIALGMMCLPDTFQLPKGDGTLVDVTNDECIISILMGLWAGLFIGLITEYYTSHSYAPVREIAHAQVTTAATGIISGLALGYMSCVVPIILLAIVIVISHTLCGMYGIALGALGMLSTLTISLTIDGYGPISDNAGGIAEMSGCDEHVREITDALDAAGNTTAAIGKGFAIGSAALVSLALFGAFKERAKIDTVNVADSWTFAGLLIGALLPYFFSAMTMTSVSRAANQMVLECKEQFPAILNEGKEPEYSKCIKISTEASLREMILPGLLVIMSPLVMCLVAGKNCTAGLLVGALVSGVQLAISMSNTGGAWDNSKKYIKADGLENSGEPIYKYMYVTNDGLETAERYNEQGDENKFLRRQSKDGTWEKVKNKAWETAHANSVTGDTVGDPLKDTSGPSLNILVKLSAITSLVFASVFDSLSNGEGGPMWLNKFNGA